MSVGILCSATYIFNNTNTELHYLFDMLFYMQISSSECEVNWLSSWFIISGSTEHDKYIFSKANSVNKIITKLCFAWTQAATIFSVTDLPFYLCPTNSNIPGDVHSSSRLIVEAVFSLLVTFAMFLSDNINACRSETKMLWKINA